MTTEKPCRLVLADLHLLPEVFGKVLDAKGYLQSGTAQTAAQAARLAGISRTAFYKYREAVYPYDAAQAGKIVTVHFLLSDRPGVLSGVLAAFAQSDANILTLNQNIPAGNTASVSISARIDRLNLPLDAFIENLRGLTGVQRISRVAEQKGV